MTIDQPARRLLLVTYAYPPDLEVGALRWQKFTRHAFEMGWGIDVVTRYSRELKRTDDAGLRDLPSSTRIVGVAHEPRGLLLAHRAALGMRARLRASGGIVAGPASVEPGATPASASGQKSMLRALKDRYTAVVEYDNYRRWAHAAFRAGLRMFDSQTHRAIVTSGPPHMAHEAGRLLSRATGLPLVVDFRDLWSGVERLDSASPLWRWFAERYERRVIDQARLIVANTDPAAEWLREAYRDRADRVITVMNGFDDEPELPTPPPTSRFIIAFSGSIYLDRSPVELFRASAELIRDLQLEPKDFGIEFIGEVAQYKGHSVTDLAEQAGIKRFVELYSKRPRKELYELLSQAAMLVNLPQDSHRAIPAKVFEYMRFPAWLLVLAEQDSATAKLFVDTDADVVSPHDVTRIAAVIKERFLAFRAGVRPAPVAGQGAFSRRMQARRLFSAIDAVVDGAVAPSTESRALSARSDAMSEVSSSPKLP